MSRLKLNLRNGKRLTNGARGFSRLYVQAIFALAAALALSTSACGKKDDAPAAVPAPAPKAAPATTTNTGTVGRVAGTTPTELNRNSGTSASNRTGEAITNRLRGEGARVEGEPDPKAVAPAVTVNEVEPVSMEVESVVYYDPSGLTRDQIFNKKAQVDLAGPSIGELVRSDIVSSDGQEIFYTGAGKDTLRTHLHALVNERAATLDDETRAADKVLAQTIQLADFNVDWSSRRAVLNFRFERLDKHGKLELNKVKIEGPLDNLTRFTVGSLKVRPFLAAEVACMDISGGCKTVHIRVQDRSTGRTQTAHLIARHTNATMDIDGTKRLGASGNPEYERLLGVLVNTTTQPSGQNVVEQLTLTTSETIGGASNFAVKLTVRLRDQWGRTGGDIIEMTGPLAKPLNSELLDVAANVTPTFTVINNEIVPTSAIGTYDRFVDSISDVRLVRNNGRGVLQLDLTIRNTTGGSPEQISLAFGRIHTPTGPVRLQMQ